MGREIKTTHYLDLFPGDGHEDPIHDGGDDEDQDQEIQEDGTEESFADVNPSSTDVEILMEDDDDDDDDDLYAK